MMKKAIIWITSINYSGSQLEKLSIDNRSLYVSDRNEKKRYTLCKKTEKYRKSLENTKKTRN